jgi:uncharacterized protein YbjT (DUF2867 family)
MATVLLVGATGFIGGRLLHALRAAGHDVICGVRPGVLVKGCECVEADFNTDRTAAQWLPRLSGIDVVINAVGILRESAAASFQALHVDGPTALFRACVEARVKKVIQISALGADLRAVSGYHVSKKRGDDVLAALPLAWIIVQPSLVFGDGGASAALFTRLAALPVLPVPGDGGQHIQPVHVDDLCECIVRLVGSDAHDRTRVAAVGSRPVTLREFLDVLRRSLGFRSAAVLRVPMPLVRMAAAAGRFVPGALLDAESLGMLLRGNVASPARITAVLGRPPRSIENFVAGVCATATANEARLSWLLPLLRVSIAIVWIVTAIVSFGVYPVDESYALLERVGLTGSAAAVALYGAAALDLVFGIGIFVLRDRRWLWRAQMLLIVGYSIIIAVYLPEQWLHPYGPMLKNLPLLAAILLLHEFDSGRIQDREIRV